MPARKFVTARQHLQRSRRSLSPKQVDPLTHGVAPPGGAFKAPVPGAALTQKNAAVLDNIAEFADAELVARASQQIPLVAGAGLQWLPLSLQG